MSLTMFWPSDGPIREYYLRRGQHEPETSQGGAPRSAGPAFRPAEASPVLNRGGGYSWLNATSGRLHLADGTVKAGYLESVRM